MASSTGAHAEGWSTTASGISSHAEGRDTIANRQFQHVQGRFNNTSWTAGNLIDVVGWGDSEGARKNISGLTQSGDLHLKGKVYIQANDNSSGGIELVPNIVGNAGLYLAVNDSATGLEWKAASGGGTGGTTNYTALTNKPTINGATLTGAITVAGEKGITVDGTTAIKVGHSNTAITAGTFQGTKSVGDTSNAGGKTTIPKFTYDAYGHITAVTDPDTAFEIYPPITAGTSTDVWQSIGSGRGKWQTTLQFSVSGKDSATATETTETFRVISNV